MGNIRNSSILIIDDEENMLNMLSVALTRAGYSVVSAGNGNVGLEKIREQEFDVVLCDLKMPKMDGLQFLEKVNSEKADLTIIMMSAYATVDTAVQAMKMGAYDFITKPFKIDEILCILRKCEERIKLKNENRHLRQKVQQLQKGAGFEDIVGESPELLKVLSLARQSALYDTTVLITGESGTGKELIARGIHRASKRSEGPFVTINCGAIPENLLESELFGYVKGAFTGADADHVGLFEAASGGTILLDEIGELPVGMQVKLLRVLQEREVRPLAATANRKIDVRVLAATAKKLSEEIEQGKFRQDLYFRLNVIEIQMPPLRNRKGDVQLLIDAFIASESVHLGRPIRIVTNKARSLLESYSWPGNVRQLKNVLERAIIFSENGIIEKESLPNDVCDGPAIAFEGNFLDTLSIKEAKSYVESHLIIKALEKTNGNKSQAAELLEISYPSLLNKIKEYNLM